jgi:hypothetical protein
MPSPRSDAGPLAHTCARGVNAIAELIEDASVVYDEEVPPTVPEGETLAAWRAEHAPRIRHPRLHQLSLRLRRLVRRLDGTVIDTRFDRLRGEP